MFEEDNREGGGLISRTSHHHVHTAFTTTVSGDVGVGGEVCLRPASVGDLVDGQCRVLRSRQSGSAACHEQEARIMGFEQEGHKSGCHDLSSDGVDVPGSVPCLTHSHGAGCDSLVK